MKLLILAWLFFGWAMVQNCWLFGRNLHLAFRAEKERKYAKSGDLCGNAMGHLLGITVLIFMGFILYGMTAVQLEK